MKYKLTDETIKHNGRRLYRIQALKDFGNVKANDLGGWIQSKTNLSQNGNCWVYDEARIFGNARVFGNAKVFDNAWVYDTAQIFGDARVSENAQVYGNTKIKDGCIR
jgi:UDP-3-O-[3-hydroxymyristoyl] glucosamine N-acyltransferase